MENNEFNVDKGCITLMFIIGVCCFIIGGIVTLLKDENDREAEKEAFLHMVDSAKKTQREETRGFNFKKGEGYIPIFTDPNVIYTDEEIREMRRNNPEYIINVSGRQIKNQRELSEQQIEEYIDDNPDLLDQYKD